MRKGFNISLSKSGAEQFCSYLFEISTRAVKSIMLLAIIFLADISNHLEAQGSKPGIKLGAYYFAGWAGKNELDDGNPGHEWAKGMPTHYTKKLATEFAGRTPIWGWRDDNQELMERQIDLAAENGISFFSFCWYWHNDKGAINIAEIEKDSKHSPMQMFMKATNNSKMEFSLLIANHTGFEIIGYEAWKQAADYWITIFKHPSYLKINGKPFITIFVPQGANPRGLAYLQEAALKAGFPGVEVACNWSGKLEDGFTIRTHYNILPGYGKPSEKHPYSELVEGNIKEWYGTPEQPYIPVLTSGWDRRPWEAPDGYTGGVIETSWYFDGRTPAEFGKFLQKMVDWIEQHPEQTTKEKLALIYAWNEIGEGGWLVPCKDDPNGEYLKVIKQIVLGN
jgi:hypothetical protein